MIRLKASLDAWSSGYAESYEECGNDPNAAPMANFRLCWTLVSLR